ncbi:hypothetical protein [Actinomyces culturomici]|uniref:hypothetical protein n=1 Tax=Actinomyces culturomici TaxID=1926276 RepID=UPI000E2099E4
MSIFARLRPCSLLAILLLTIGLTLASLPAHAGTLSGVFHDPYGFDEQYTTQPTERAPRDPMTGDAVWLSSPGFCGGSFIWLLCGHRRRSAGCSPLGIRDRSDKPFAHRHSALSIPIGSHQRKSEREHSA